MAAADKTILYIAILSNKKVPLADYENRKTSDYQEFLKNVEESLMNGSRTLAHNDCMYTYIYDEKLSVYYICLFTKGFSLKKVQNCLEEVKIEFQKKFKKKKIKKAKRLSFNPEIQDSLRDSVKMYTNEMKTDKAVGDLGSTQKEMFDNLDILNERDDKIGNLLTKNDMVKELAATFASKAR